MGINKEMRKCLEVLKTRAEGFNLEYDVLLAEAEGRIRMEQRDSLIDDITNVLLGNHK